MARTSRLDQFVANHLAGDEDLEEGVLGNFVIVAEIIYPDGAELRVAPSEGAPPWLVSGMLDQAHDVVKSGAAYEEIISFIDDEDDEGES